VAGTKTFTHELGGDWLSLIAADSRVLDFGCGYGRTLAALGKLNSVGYDFSERMIARGLAEYRDLDLRVAPTLPVPEPDESIDVALLLAVLTCVPQDEDQENIVAELYRLLKPGGLLMLSDMPLQTDERNVVRYEKSLSLFGVEGVFVTDDGAVVRHHSSARFSHLLRDFTVIETRSVGLNTMNGHVAFGTQVLARKDG
jgi:SAM-dependent methyltransferase